MLLQAIELLLQARLVQSTLSVVQTWYVGATMETSVYAPNQCVVLRLGLEMLVCIILIVVAAKLAARVLAFVTKVSQLSVVAS